MTETRLWDRAAAVPAVRDGRRRPQLAALPEDRPSVETLFDFMRDAESRFSTLRMRVVERAWTARGEETTTTDVMLRHPGVARVTTSRTGRTAKGDYEVWISDGDLVRTYSGVHRLGTQRPVRNRPRGLSDTDFPGPSRVYEPITPLPAETLPETMVHPAGYCQNFLATGVCAVVGSDVVNGREAVLLECDHPRATELPGDRPDFRIEVAVDRATGIVLRLVESMGGMITRQVDVVELGTDVPLPPSAFDFVFPTGTTMLY
jgi:outer membrane lipoprotein-sorting protein